MKKITLVFIISLFCLQIKAQSPELFKTWYLTSIEFDLGGELIISNINPPISPTLIIDEFLNYEGIGACNSFEGEFTYLFENNEETLTPISFSETLEICENQEHIDFEGNYFGYFEYEQPPLTFVFLDETHLSLEKSPGFILNYSNEPLAVENFSTDLFTVYPNPVSDQLYITLDNLHIKNIIIYTITGTKILEQKNNIKIDVSNLFKGVYFIEITSAEGKTVRRFIKK